MTVVELIDIVQTESGQKFLDFGEFNIDPDYKDLVEKNVLPVISKHKPKEERVQIAINASPYTFTVAEKIPDWISRVDPLGGGGAALSAAMILSPTNTYGVKKPTLFHRYDKPDLFIEKSGSFHVWKCFNMWLEEAPAGTFTIKELDDSRIPDLVKLTLGHTLVAIGRSRRAATLTELPFDFDAAELVSEGLEMIATFEDNIAETNKWWLAVG